MKTLSIVIFSFLVFCAFPFVSIANQAERPAAAGCDGGGEEAERFYQEGLDYSKGLRGRQKDLQKAIKAYGKALELGSAKAAINLGAMIRSEDLWDLDIQSDRYAKMNAFFLKAIEMGCSEGYNQLAYSYRVGLGVDVSISQYEALLESGIQKGSTGCMASLGQYKRSIGDIERAKQLLQQALDAGYGTAVVELHKIHQEQGDVKGQLTVLRQAGKLGNIYSLRESAKIYQEGRLQPQDVTYAQCFTRIADGINPNIAADPVDLDTLCPPKPFVHR